jgi:hypothetical protein
VTRIFPARKIADRSLFEIAPLSRAVFADRHDVASTPSEIVFDSFPVHPKEAGTPVDLAMLPVRQRRVPLVQQNAVDARQRPLRAAACAVSVMR